MAVCWLIIAFVSLLRRHDATKTINAPDDSSEWFYSCTEADCADATIDCPTNADCHITCDENKACYNATISWPVEAEGYGTLSCIGEESCIDVNHPVPDPDEEYSIVCGLKACTTTTGVEGTSPGSEMHCPRNADCHIACDGIKSCRLASIDWPESGYGTLSCDGESACTSVLHPIPEPNTDYTITCSGYAACQSSTIRCPSNARCTVICNSDSACYNAYVEWYDFLGVLECSQNIRSACRGVNHPIPPPNQDLSIECLNEGTCSHGTLNCPSNADCNVTCGGLDKRWSCNQGDIWCPETGNYHVACTDTWSCINVCHIVHIF